MQDYVANRSMSLRAQKEFQDSLKGAPGPSTPGALAAVSQSAATLATTASVYPARQKHLNVGAAGDGSWVSTLASGTAQKPSLARQHARPCPGRLSVPKPSRHTPLPTLSDPKPCRRRESDILSETQSYARDQFFRRSPILDAAARRRQDQLLFEHGRKGVQQMEQAERQLAAEKRRLAAAGEAGQDSRAALIDQVCSQMLRTRGWCCLAKEVQMPLLPSQNKTGLRHAPPRA